MENNDEIKDLLREAKYIISRLLYEKELTESQTTFLNSFIDRYYELLNKNLTE